MLDMGRMHTSIARIHLAACTTVDAHVSNTVCLPIEQLPPLISSLNL